MKLRVDKLKEIHEEREALTKKYLEERALLESKYEKLSQPLFEKRKEVIGGAMDAEIAASGDDAASEEEEEDAGIPLFWACAIQQMPVTNGLVSETDLECLSSLKDIRCVSFENGEGFKLEFEFGPNDFFENEILTKTYDVPNLLLADEPILKNVEGCEIVWKPGKSLTHKEITKQQRGTGKNAGQTRTITKKVRQESFFHFFTPPKMPSLETASEEEVMQLEQAFDDDYDVAQSFRSHIVPKAVLWFAGDAMEQEMEAAMEGMEWPSQES
jgi:nucleosome assembly protein 1-like 1